MPSDDHLGEAVTPQTSLCRYNQSSRVSPAMAAAAAIAGKFVDVRKWREGFG
jgi:hypothetical protein